MFGEHDQLAGASPVAELVGLQEVCAAPATWCRRRLVRTSSARRTSSAELEDLGFELVGRRRGRGGVDHVVLELLELLVVEVVEVEVLQVGELDALREIRDRDRARRRRRVDAALGLLGESLPAAAQRVVDRLG